MAGEDQKLSLSDSDITTGVLITQRGAETINEFVGAVRQAQEQGQQEVVLPLAAVQKVAALLKDVTQRGATSDGTDFVQNDRDPHDPVRVGD